MEEPEDNRSLVWLWRQWGWTDKANAFVFDYHFLWPWMGDRMTLDLSTLLPRDVADYRELGLSGLINCGCQRMAYPDGWPLYLTARLLCGEQPGDKERVAYYRIAYGGQYAHAMAFLDGLVEVTGACLHRPKWADGLSWAWWQKVPADLLTGVESYLRDSRSSLEEEAAGASGATAQRSWKLLLHLHGLYTRFVAVQRIRWDGVPAETLAALEDLQDFVQKTEPEIAPAMDPSELLFLLDRQKETVGERF
jgi:hypothetical protein